MRRRLFLMSSASMLVVWLGVSWFVHARLSHEVDEIYDAQLLQSGRILVGIIRASANSIELPELRAAMPGAQFDGIPQVHAIVDQQIRQTGKYERVIGVQVVDGDGALLFRSPGAPAVPFSLHRTRGFSDTEIDGVRWRLCSFHDTNPDRVVHVGEQYAIRQEISSYLLRSMAMPVLLGIAVVGALIWLSIDRGLGPLAELTRQVQNRKPNDLGAVQMITTSREIRPIVNALNDLLARVRTTFDSERRFTGDAAHELRTPLAAVKVQAQVARAATNDAERAKALDGVIAGVDRTAHLVTQLLELSRLDWQQGPGTRNITTVTSITETVSFELSEFARDSDVSVSGNGDPDTPIDADETLVSMLICNLLDNAIRYTDPGGQVRWSVTRQAPYILLEITDTGPGIPADERLSVFDRFRRLPGSRGSGAGLGLSIVRRIADLYDWEISLADPESGPGLRVRTRFHLAEMDDKEDSGYTSRGQV